MLSFLATTFRAHSIMFALRGDGGGPIKMPMYANRMGMGFALLHYCRRVWPISDFPMISNSCVLICHSVPRRLLCYLLVFKLLQAAKSLVLGRKIFASGCGCTILKIHVDIQALERFKASMNYELPCSTSHSQEASSNLFLNHLSNHAYNAHFLMKIMYSTTPNLPPFLKTTPIQIDERKRI